MPGALLQWEKLPGYRSEIAQVKQLVATKTTVKSRGLISLDFA